jgi:hypothetical protein
MERFSFGDDVAFVPPGDLLDRVTIAPLTSPFEEGRRRRQRSSGSRPADDSSGIERPGRTSLPS